MKRLILTIIIAWITLPLFADIGVRLETAAGMQGDTIEAGLYVDGTLTGQNVVSCQFQIAYNQNLVELLDVTNGSMLAGASDCVWEIHKESTYYVSITNAFSNALSGTGELVQLKFRLIAGGSTDLTFRGNATNNFFNEGQPAMTFTNGRINITALPVISVNIPSNTSPMAVGATVNLSAGGGVAPYTWEVTDNTLANINTSGQLTANGIGVVRVRATDSRGYSGTSANIEIRGYRLAISDTAFYQNQYVDIPVNFQNLASKPVFSGEFSVQYNSTILTFDSLIVENLIIGGNGNTFSSYVSNPNASTQQLRIGFANPEGFTVSGALAKIRFKIANAASGSTNLNFTSVEINNDEQAIVASGVFRITALPALSITPNNATFEHFAGETEQLAVSGGAAPYVWTSTKPLVASVDENGLVSVHMGGDAVIRVSDVWGSYKTVTFHTYDTKIKIADTLGLVVHRIFRIPVEMTLPVPAERNLTAIQGKISCDAPQIAKISIAVDGSLTADCATGQQSTDGGCTFAISGTQAITQAGTLFYAVIEFNETIRQDDSFNISLSDIVLNEGSPNAVIEGGTLTVNVQQGVTAEAAGSSNEGSISVDLESETTMTFTGTMTVSLPDGFTLDLENTLLNPNLEGVIALAITEMGNNTWLFTYTMKVPQGSIARSITALEPYTNIVKISYSVNPDVPDGTYQATIRDVLLTFDDSSELNEPEFPVTIVLDKSMTGINSPDASNVKVMLHDGVLSIDTEFQERIEIYSLDGKLAGSFEKSPGRIDKSIPGWAGQILIVKGKNWSVKALSINKYAH